MEKTIIVCLMLFLPAFAMVISLTVQKRNNEARGHGHGIGHRHGSWMAIDYFAFSSKLRRWNATFKLAFTLVIIFLCIGLNNAFVSAVIIVSMFYMVVAVGGLSTRDYISVLSIPIAFILISVIAIIVDFSKLPVGDFRIFIGFGYLYSSISMLFNGLRLMLKIIAAVSALQFMILTTPPSEVILVIRKMHVPNKFADLMNMIYRYIFILLDAFSKMKDAAEARLGYRDFKTFCRTFGGTAGNVLVLSLKKAEAYYDAMESRCYDGELLFLEEEKKISLRTIISATLFIFYLLLIWFFTK